MPRKNRNYKEEYRNYHAKPEQRKNNDARKKARRAAVKKHGKAKMRGKEVDHKKPLSKGGSRSLSNTRVVSKKFNRMKYNKT